MAYKTMKDNKTLRESQDNRTANGIGVNSTFWLGYFNVFNERPIISPTCY